MKCDLCGREFETQVAFELHLGYTCPRSEKSGMKKTGKLEDLLIDMFDLWLSKRK